MNIKFVWQIHLKRRDPARERPRMYYYVDSLKLGIQRRLMPSFYTEDIEILISDNLE